MTLRIGWAQADITPTEPVLIAGQFHARLREGVMDPLTATVLVLEGDHDQAVLVSGDIVGVPNELRAAFRERLAGIEGLDPQKVVLHATHTHSSIELRVPYRGQGHCSGNLGVDVEAWTPEQGIAFVSDRIAAAVWQAWEGRAPGRIAFGQGQAVVGRNRRWVNTAGASFMYGNTNDASFSHIEGYEDHSVGVLATRDAAGRLTGLVVNVACPSQVSESVFQLSADYWHDTRVELRRRLGSHLFVHAQCSTAGDQSPHVIHSKPVEQRMLDLAGRTVRQEIAVRIADAVERTLGVLGDRGDAAEPLQHHVETLPLPLNPITEDQARAALQEAEKHRLAYEDEVRKLQADPSLRKQPRWYVPATRASRLMIWQQSVADRRELQKTCSEYPCELHVIRLGDAVFATNPFEYYLDYGIFIKARSRAAQTFLIQLAGAGTYVPSRRSLGGGGYGSVPASNIVGPEGGRKLAERTVDVIAQLWA